MKLACDHKRLRATSVFLEPNHEQQTRRMALMVRCHECGQEFEFLGVEGEETRLSENRQELGLTITEARKGMVQ